MTGSWRRYRWLLLLALLTVVGLFLYRSREETLLRRQLDVLARACSRPRGSSALTRAVQLNEILGAELSNPVSVDVAELGQSRRTPSELAEMLGQYQEKYESVEIRLEDVLLQLDAPRNQAVASGALFVELVEPSSLRRTEPRRFSTTLVSRGGHWLIAHLKVSESRIDQPEARP